MRRMLALFFVLSTFSAAAQDATTPRLPSVSLPPSLERVLRDYEIAWRARDAAALADLFAEDGFVMGSGQPPVRGREAIREAYAESGGPLVLRALAYSTEGKVGYIIGAFGRDASTDIGKFVLALKKVRGRWLIAADMDNSSTSSRKPPTAATPP
ncbi:MAG: SgcJ/EcaC family oxidoreductase [Thermoanaerobaculia bacterium]|nr:SgcJ/EcaC family oxidoreductase [Thermoanaerobaculia bacterium]